MYERAPVRVRIVWDGKERAWSAGLNCLSWAEDNFGEVWVALPPIIKSGDREDLAPEAP